MAELGEALDLNLAWRRLLYDYKQYNFVRRPHQIDLVKRFQNEWIPSILSQIDNGYDPSVPEIFDVPKRRGLIRTGRYLTLSDHLVYNACVTALQPQTTRKLKWSQGEVDLAYQLTSQYKLRRWFEEKPFVYWEQFRETSLSYLDDFDWMLETDIASFYDNIHIQTLYSKLNECKPDNKIVKLLVKCLRTWEVFPGCGLPQSYCASHILAKLYLETVDQAIRNGGLLHVRYNDDIRVFCNSKATARKAISVIAASLRKHGLTLQSAKTKIMNSGEARTHVNGVQQVLQPIERKIEKKDTRYIVEVGDYDDIIISVPVPTETNRKVIRNAVNEHLLAETFDKTLFHYLLNRLGRFGDTMLVEYCLSILSVRPEETRHVLKYFKKLNCYDEVEGDLVSYMQSEDAIYDYPLYLIVQWRYDASIDKRPGGDFTQLVRSYAFDENRRFFLKSISRAYLARYGNTADLQKIMDRYVTWEKKDQVECICNLASMEKSRRNAFFIKAQQDGEMHNKAVQFVKETTP